MRFTIVIPTRNRPERLRQCLESLRLLSGPSFEVVIVDDGSSPPLHLDEFVAQFALRCVRQENTGPARARNRGVEAASGEWLVFLDDDCTPRPDWLQQLDDAAVRNPGSMLGGSVRNGSTANVYAALNQELVDFVVGFFFAARSPLRFVTSNCMAVPRDAFLVVGGFDGSFPLAGGEDREFCARWLRSGREIVRANEAWIEHYHPQTLSSFLRMHYRYGRGAALFHGAMGTSPAGFRSTRFYREMFRGAAGSDAGKVILLVLSQLAASAGFFGERLRGRGK